MDIGEKDVCMCAKKSERLPEICPEVETNKCCVFPQLRSAELQLRLALTTPRKAPLSGAAEIISFHLRYEPEKHYIFILKVARLGIKDPSYIFRTYK